MILKYIKIWGSLAAVLFLSACSESSDFNQDNNGDYDGQKILDLAVSLPDRDIATRDEDALIPSISNGQLVDQLSFCLYEIKTENSEKKYELIDKQYVIDMKNRRWPYNVRLAIDQSKDYQIVFWAQHKACTAYDATDIRNIKVKYPGIDDNDEDFTNKLNNDETRDAFAASYMIEKESALSHTVILHRVSAQINIATSGADYANLIYDPYLNPANVTITQSMVTVSGVANHFDALTGIAKAVDSENQDLPEDQQLTANFDWNWLPAWINLENIPEFKDEYKGYVKEKKEDTDKTWIDNPFIKTTDEEFLNVELNGDKIFEDYWVPYPTRAKEKTENEKYYKTEIFKYLSMTYVLVPSSNVYDKDKETDETVGGGNVNMTFNLRQKYETEETTIKEIYLKEKTLMSVPVRANFRTNILGGLYYEEPDPTSIFNYYQLPLILSYKFEGDNNERFYTATISITRQFPGDDGLSISQINGEDIAVTADRIKIENTITFIEEECEYTFTVNSNFDILISSNVDEKHYEITDNIKEGKSSKTLKIKKGATAGTFTINIDKKNPS